MVVSVYVAVSASGEPEVSRAREGARVAQQRDQVFALMQAEMSSSRQAGGASKPTVPGLQSLVDPRLGRPERCNGVDEARFEWTQTLYRLIVEQ